jgi:large subunit ribosomal protein L10
MNRDQKAAAIAEIAAHIDKSQAILAVDYRGISVPQVAELRANLRSADATFKVVKNSLTERAADEAGVATLKDFLTGPTALTFIRGDVATAAKAIADYSRTIQLLPFKGGLMGGAALDVDQLQALSRLPSREVLYGQLVGVVASPVSGLVRTLSALLGGLAVALGQVRDKMESGEIRSGAATAPARPETAADEANAEAEAVPAETQATAVEEPQPTEEPPAETQATAVREPQPTEEPPAGGEAPAVEAETTAAEEPQTAEEPAADGEAHAVEAEATVVDEPQAAEEPPAEGEAPATGALAAEEAPAAQAAAPSVGQPVAEATSANQDQPEAEPALEHDNKADASEQQKPDAAADSTEED